MRHLILLTLSLLFPFSALHAQDVPHAVEILDLNQTPVSSHRLENHLQVADGVYMKHLYQSEENVFSFFDGEVVQEIYRGNRFAFLVGGTDQGVYVLEEDPTIQGGRNVVFATRSGAVDTLNAEPIRLPDTYQLGNNLLTFTSPTE